jgi:predicted nucleic acid-binding protein
MGILNEISGNRVYLDTSSFIFYVEGIDPYATELDPLFAAIDQGTIEAVTGEITVAECLVKPMRDRNSVLIRAFHQTLQNKTYFQLAPITRVLWESAADIRSRHSIKLPDAVHLATAESVGCTTLITNDGDFKGKTSMEVVVLSEILRP